MTATHSSKHRRIQWLRILVQTVSLLIFLKLLLQAQFTGNNTLGAVATFFHFDPLLGLATTTASRMLAGAFLLSLITVVVTALFGRYVCGWVCPLGTLLQGCSFLFKKTGLRLSKVTSQRYLAWKYLVLVAVLGASACTLNLAGYLDPIAFLYRAITLAVLPALGWMADGAASFFTHVGLHAAGKGLLEAMQGQRLARTFDQALIVGVLLLGVVLLNTVRERFWCRYVCPAGALLGVLARWNLVKVHVNPNVCRRCNQCTRHCPTQANPVPAPQWRPGECIYCHTCASRCPTAAITLPLKGTPAKPQPTDLTRRKLVLTSSLGLVVAPLFHVSESTKRPSEQRIRPPGAMPEPSFLAACIKCGACMRVCPTNGLQSAITQAGPEGVWTPILVPRLGPCDFACTLCTQVCPTGAIQALPLHEKRRVRIGSAWIKRHRCVPYTTGRLCTICETLCPTSPKAIQLIEAEVILADGTVILQGAPVVDLQHCIGCGICEAACPITDEPAIYCTSWGESRANRQEGRG